MRTEVSFSAPFKHVLVNVENLEVFELLYTTLNACLQNGP